MKILSHEQIIQKIRRLSYEILEHNIEADEFYLVGVNNTGYRFAEEIYSYMNEICEKKLHLNHISLNPADPVNSEVNIDIDKSQLEEKTVIIIDDVASSGRTLFYACKSIMDILPTKVSTVVLVDRTHKLFPIKINHVGLSLATTLKENISVSIDESDKFSVSLD